MQLSSRAPLGQSLVPLSHLHGTYCNLFCRFLNVNQEPLAFGGSQSIAPGSRAPWNCMNCLYQTLSNTEGSNNLYFNTPSRWLEANFENHWVYTSQIPEILIMYRISVYMNNTYCWWYWTRKLTQFQSLPQGFPTMSPSHILIMWQNSQ